MGKTVFPENFKIVQLASPETTNSGKTSDYISLKDCLRCTIVVDLTQATGHATAIALYRGTAVDGTGAVVLTTVVPIWVNQDCGATDTLVRQTDAINFTVTDDIKDKQLVFQVDPVTLGDTFDVLSIRAANSSAADNFWSVTAYLETRYEQATPPTAITD